MEGKFTDKDVERLTSFLNFVAKKGKFELDVKEVIDFYGLLAWAQKDLIKKMKDNILEVIDVVEPTKKSKK